MISKPWKACIQAKKSLSLAKRLKSIKLWSIVKCTSADHTQIELVPSGVMPSIIPLRYAQSALIIYLLFLKIQIIKTENGCRRKGKTMQRAFRRKVYESNQANMRHIICSNIDCSAFICRDDTRLLCPRKAI